MRSVDADEVAFMGRITAGFTHEMKNVLAIIKESAGLMEDLLAVTQDGSFAHKERFTRVLTKIRDQVQRGVDLSTRLNRFAHAPDEPIATVDLNDAAAQVAVLAERFARLKGVTLRAEAGEGDMSLTTTPLGVQMALFMAMECCWSHMKSGSELKLFGRSRGNDLLIYLLPQGDAGDPAEFGPALEGSEKWRVLQEILTMLGFRAEREGEGAGFAVVFTRSSG